MTQEQKPRVVLVGCATFEALKHLQTGAPGPRLEIRYWVEGMVRSLQQDHTRHAPWLEASRGAALRHLQAQHTLSGTGGPPAAEGAQARTSETPRPSTHVDCKALHIGEHAFEWLKGVQGTTRAPRIEIRYLLEGAVALFGEGSFPDGLVRNARRALVEHLAQLDTSLTDSSLLEKTQ